jgi:hypothetical protein
MNTGPGYFIEKRQRATEDGRTTLVTLQNRSSRVRGQSLATSIGSLSNGNRGPARTEKPVSNSNGHHILTLGERDDVPLSNPSFAEKKREGNALDILTGSTHRQRFLESQIHMHNYFLISKAHQGPCTGTTSTQTITRSPKVPEGKKVRPTAVPSMRQHLGTPTLSRDVAVIVVTSTIICYTHLGVVLSSQRTSPNSPPAILWRCFILTIC